MIGYDNFLQVMDEADRLIEDDYGEQLEAIFKVLPKKRQTLLFSATMTDTLQQLQEVAMNKPFFWQQKSEYVILSQPINCWFLFNTFTSTWENGGYNIYVMFLTCMSSYLVGLQVYLNLSLLFFVYVSMKYSDT